MLSWINHSTFLNDKFELVLSKSLIDELTDLSDTYKSAIMYKKDAIPKTLESISSGFIIVIESPAVWWYL